MTRNGQPCDRERRRLVTGGFGVLAACVSLPLWNLLGGCRSEGQPADTPASRIWLAQLPLGKRTVVQHAGEAVELFRSDAGVRARVLTCTHQGCTVRWEEDDGVYFCPCHDARFDAAGRPLYGPPRTPLRELPVTVHDNEVFIGG